MTSLKALTPALANILGTTAAALYERQRVLVRIKALRPKRGRGPGSGVPATSYTVAVLVVCFAKAEPLGYVVTPNPRAVALLSAMLAGHAPPRDMTIPRYSSNSTIDLDARLTTIGIDRIRGIL